MATAQVHAVEEVPPLPASVDIPERREYAGAENAALDRELCSAIQAAEAAGNSYLANLLGFELGSHYYDTR